MNGKSISVNGRIALQARNMLLRVEPSFHVPLLALPPAEESKIIILSERATSMVECAPSVEVTMGEVNYSIILGRPLTDSPRNSPYKVGSNACNYWAHICIVMAEVDLSTSASQPPL